ncbi:MAG: DUF4416 family protein [Candidatus Omnitrophota bacterium]|nr:DUF4416 family protein [Candidatus Omnitrophota bacterium]
MLTRHFPLPVKFFASLIYTSEDLYQKAKKELIKIGGALDYESERFEFTFTEYYCHEMGKPLFRRFIVFRRLRNPEYLVVLKIASMRIERTYARQKRRSVNIDPGYLNEAKLVLATTKDFYHRLYLGKGIYAEVTLCYQDKAFCSFPTTYPDYKSQSHLALFHTIRELYRAQIHDVLKK